MCAKLPNYREQFVIREKMDSSNVRKFLTFVLLLCLLAGLIVFCVLYIVSNRTNADESKMCYNATAEDIRQTTEQDHDQSHTDTTTPLTLTTTAAENQDYQIKLMGDDRNSSGKVLIDYNGTTGFVCNDEFDDVDAQVVCKELGYRNGLSYKLLPSNPTLYSKFTTLEPVISELHCAGNETKISDCEGFELRNNITECTWFAAVLCYNDQPYELRLVNEIHPDSGMVEIKVGGVWGLFCAMRNFDDDVADILCRGMNYTSGFASGRGMIGEATNSKIWVPYISCQDQVNAGSFIESIFECELVLNVENIAYDRTDHRNNRYSNEYMACLNKPNSYAATVQCLE